MPTANQILGAQIRAANQVFERARRKPFKGGYEVPTRIEVLHHLAKKFGMKPAEISYYLTYSRSCTHAWSAGACDDCPA